MEETKPPMNTTYRSAALTKLCLIPVLLAWVWVNLHAQTVEIYPSPHPTPGATPYPPYSESIMPWIVLTNRERAHATVVP